ncbi:MAG: hypothetical protein WCS51_02590 [Bacilli bacterium]
MKNKENDDEIIEIQSESGADSQSSTNEENSSNKKSFVEININDKEAPLLLAGLGFILFVLYFFLSHIIAFGLVMQAILSIILLIPSVTALYIIIKSNKESITLPLILNLFVVLLILV